MYDLPALKHQLSSIARALSDPEFLLPRPNEDERVARREEKLWKLQDDLEGIWKRRIPQVESSIKSEEARIKSIPHDSRWPMQDRVKQLTKELDDVRKEAEVLAEKVLELLRKNGTLDMGQRAKAFQDLAEYGEKVFGHGTRAEILNGMSGPVYQQPSQLSTPLNSIVPLVVLACVGLKRLSEKFGQNQPNKRAFIS
jgi:hypothetical protein